MPRETGKTEGRFDTMKYAFEHATHPQATSNLGDHMPKSTFESNRSLILTLGGIAAVAVGAYLVWTNRSRIMSAVEKTGIPEKLSANMDKVADFASNQLGLTTESSSAKGTGRNAETRAS